MKYIVDLKDVNLSHLEMVGGKNASTGEMIQNLADKGVLIPGGFATTAMAYKKFLSQNALIIEKHNAQLMIPFVRTVDELHNVVELMEHYGLKRGENNLKVFMMCEVPSNVILADNPDSIVETWMRLAAHLKQKKGMLN